MSLESLGDTSHFSLIAVGTWAQIAGAIGTFLAVVVALFGSRLRVILVPPRLDIDIGEERGVVFAGGGHESARWYHLHVSNPHRWSPITSARVLLCRIEWPDAADDFQPAWEGALPLQWRYSGAMGIAANIGPARDCDLCVIMSDSPSDHVLRLTLGYWGGIEDRHTTYRKAVKLRLTLQARGLEADSRSIQVMLEWDGEGAIATSMKIVKI